MSKPQKGLWHLLGIIGHVAREQLFAELDSMHAELMASSRNSPALYGFVSMPEAALIALAKSRNRTVREK